MPNAKTQSSTMNQEAHRDKAMRLMQQSGKTLSKHMRVRSKAVIDIDECCLEKTRGAAEGDSGEKDTETCSADREDFARCST